MAMMLNPHDNYQQIIAQTFSLRQGREGGATAITAPALPAGYQEMGQAAQPLSTDHEGWWIVFALNVAHDALGMLIYTDDSQAVCFLVAQESLLALFAMLDSLMDLAADATAQFSDDHMHELYAIWQAWKQVQTPDGKRICVWCWNEANPDQPFPAQESSSCCARHRHRVVRKAGVA